MNNLSENLTDPLFASGSKPDSRLLAQQKKISDALTAMHTVATELNYPTEERIRAAEVMAELGVSFNSLAQTLHVARIQVSSPYKQQVSLKKPRAPGTKRAPKAKKVGNTISDLIPMK